MPTAPTRSQNWRDSASCRDAEDPNRFATRTKANLAPSECAGCPVIEQCRSFGEATGSEGWFGGEWMKFRMVSEDLDEKMRHLVTTIVSNTELALTIGKSKTWVSAWKAKNGVPSLRQVKGTWMNGDEPCCPRGHLRSTDTTVLNDGTKVCITCEIGGTLFPTHSVVPLAEQSKWVA